ncbi:hypothetical protein C0993_008300 [Termitomyces sp. T159_Od127]|nr:hypothetical protein C0993_008300 [Termitomyces sp. T159_Od127]
MTAAALSSIPITVFTGFLGAGKTSVILSLLPQLPRDYKVVLLKNEFGDIAVDSKLAEQSSLTAVSEILNGYKFRPDRIIIECSGSAFPATLAFQIRELERETQGDFKLDAIVTVVDAENFAGYEDTSPTAKMQSSYTDIILINKWEHVSERALDFVVDHLNTLNDSTPKIRCNGRNGVDPNLIFGLETRLFLDKKSNLGSEATPSHNDEVETVTICRGSSKSHNLNHDHCHNCVEKIKQPSCTIEDGIVKADLVRALGLLSKETVWRVKGFVKLREEGVQILNWAFGRYDLTAMKEGEPQGTIWLTVMGERGEMRRAIRTFSAALDAELA